jgi:Fe-S-cluster containining protein
MSDSKEVKVWNVNLKSGHKLKVATIEQGLRKPSPLCINCKALCCHGKIRPVITAEEFLGKKFPMEFIEPESWLKEQVPRAHWMAVLKFENGECPYWDGKELKCKIFPNCPKSCLAYDCREDSREEMKQFAKQRMEEYGSKGGE